MRGADVFSVGGVPIFTIPICNGVLVGPREALMSINEDFVVAFGQGIVDAGPLTGEAEAGVEAVGEVVGWARVVIYFFVGGIFVAEAGFDPGPALG